MTFDPLDPLAPEPSVEMTLEVIPPKVTAIRALTAAGYVLIPLNGKTPSRKNWTATKLGAFGEKELAVGNYGVALGAEDLVLDIDPRNFTPGDAPFPRLEALVGKLNATFIVKTGGGGYHVYLKKDANAAVAGKLKGYAGIDIRTAGGQVVGPGSIHPETNAPYVIAAGNPAEVMAAPAALLALLKKTETNFETQPGTSTYQDDEGTRARYVSYLTKDAPTSGSYGVACRGRDFGLPPQRTLDLMLAHWNPRRVSTRTPEEMKTRVAHAYKYATGAVGNAHPAADFDVVVQPPAPVVEKKLAWDTDKNGTIRKNFVNLLTYMRHPTSGLKNVFAFNEFTGEVVIANPAPWHYKRMPGNVAVGDADLVLLKRHLAVDYEFEMPVATIIEAMTVTAHDHKFHPVREYLTSLKWDGVKRLDTWLSDFCGAEDTEYTRACARKTICAAVMRIFRPGEKFDHVLVLEGGQGIGKSAICKILGGPFAADFSIDPHHPDSIQLMQGSWIVELAELDFKRKEDDDALKAFITRTTDKARLAYGRLAAKFPRQCIFIATVNPGPDGTYLKDNTGNRRWWPVALQPKGRWINFKGLTAARDQIFAEAVARVTSPGGEKLYMDTDNLNAAAQEAASQRHASHPWTSAVVRWVDARPAGVDFLTGQDVFLGALGGMDKQFDRRSQVAIATIMRSALGWTTGAGRDGKRVAWGYHRPTTTAPAVDDESLEGLI